MQQDIKELEKIFQLMKQYKVSKLSIGELHIEKIIHEVDKSKVETPNEQLRKMQEDFEKDLPEGSILRDPDLYAAVR